MLDVRDVARGLILAAEKGGNGEAYILSGTRVTVDELKQAAQKLAGLL